jgi:hypothetical protein
MARVLVSLCVVSVTAEKALRDPAPDAAAMVDALNNVKDYLDLEEEAVHENLQPAFEKIEETVSDMDYKDPEVFSDLGGILEGNDKFEFNHFFAVYKHDLFRFDAFCEMILSKKDCSRDLMSPRRISKN